MHRSHIASFIFGMLMITCGAAIAVSPSGSYDGHCCSVIPGCPQPCAAEAVGTGHRIIVAVPYHKCIESHRREDDGKHCSNADEQCGNYYSYTDSQCTQNQLGPIPYKLQGCSGDVCGIVI